MCPIVQIVSNHFLNDQTKTFLSVKTETDYSVPVYETRGTRARAPLR